MSAFSEALLARGREAGFPSAYRFYHRNGGRRHFGLTYVHYLRLEKGAKAPRAEAFGAILKALRLAPPPTARARFSASYLLDVLARPRPTSSSSARSASPCRRCRRRSPRAASSGLSASI